MRIPGLSLVGVVLVGCERQIPPPVIVCDVQATVEPAGTVPFTSAVRVQVRGQNADSVGIVVTRLDDAEAGAVPMTVVFEPLGEGEHVLIADGGFERGRSYEVQVLACDDEVIETSRFETTDDAGEVTDWASLDGATWYLDLWAARAFEGEAGTAGYFPVVRLSSDDEGLTAVELEYFDILGNEWFTCPETFDLAFETDGPLLESSVDGAGHDGIATWVTPDNRVRMTLDCAIKDDPSALVDCEVWSVFQLELPCPAQAGPLCYPCTWDENEDCAEGRFSGVPARPVPVPRPDPYYDPACEFD